MKIGDAFGGRIEQAGKAEVARLIVATGDWLTKERERFLEDPSEVKIPAPSGVQLVDMTLGELAARADALEKETSEDVEAMRERIKLAQGVVSGILDVALTAVTTAALSAVGSSA